MVPHLATDSVVVVTSKSMAISSSSNMTNSELNNSSHSSSGGSDCLLFEQQHLIHMEDEAGLRSSVVFGSQLIDQNSATPYSDATKVRVTRRERGSRGRWDVGVSTQCREFRQVSKVSLRPSRRIR